MRNNKACGLLMAAIAAAMLMAGCQKDTVTIRARITPFGNDKVTMTDTIPQWQIGDSIRVNTFDQSVAVSNSGNITSITVLSSATYKAVYPSEYVTAVAGYQFGLSLPQTQTYITDGNGKQVVKAPLGAYSKDLNLNFTPLGALLAINISNDFTNDNNATPDIVVDSVRVTALNESHLWGNATVENITDAANRSYVIANETGSSSVCLKGLNGKSMNMAIAADGSATCYVYIPAVSNELFSINIYTHDVNDSFKRYVFSRAQTQTSTASNGYSVVRGNLVGISYSTADASLTEMIVPHEFSVSSTQQVHFSTGNLQYQASNGTWRFAENQYDFIGGNAGNTTVTGRNTQSDWIDLFQRGSSGCDASYAPYDVISFYNGTMTGTNANYDWGVYNAISNGGNTVGQWRTLTYDEWNYLLSSRTSTNSESLVKPATVNGISGYILLPDLWAWSDPSVSTYETTFNNANNNSPAVFNASAWNDLEQFGAIFLPKSGSCTYTVKGAVLTAISYASGTATYATASTTIDNDPSKNKGKYITVGYDKNGIKVTASEWKFESKLLCAVRLVQDYVAPTTNTTSK